MEKSAKGLRRLRLNQQLSLVMTGIVLIPIILLAANMFGNMRSLMVSDKVESVQGDLRQLQANVERTVELCNMTTQAFLASLPLRDFLAKAKNGAEFTAAELMDFNNNDVAALEKLVNANPYLYQARVYALDDNIIEMMPILYRKSRMERLSWARGPWVSGSWQLDYTDNLFDRQTVSENEHIMSLVTAMESFEEGEIGVVEVAVGMPELLPGLFLEDGPAWSCLVLEDGSRFDNPAHPWSSRGDRILAAFGALPAALASEEIFLDGEPLLVSAIPLQGLGCTYVEALSLQDITRQVNTRRNLFLLLILSLTAALALAVNLLVKLTLRRFYVVLDTIGEVQEGNLAVTVPDMGGDEIGLLGNRFNRMLESINSLMEENVNRQLLAKNSEIRALQNQINAHFIYNVLESVKMMALIDEKYEIADALTALGKLLRYSMRWRKATVTVAEEVDYIRNYLSLMNLRFDYEIRLNLDLSPALLAQQIPKMTLQPLVENAVIHGIEDLAEDTAIDITGREEHGDAVIEIADFGRGMDEATLERLRREMAGEIQAGGGSGNGIGLKNVQDRIVMAFGRSYGLAFASEPGRHTRVIVRIPLITSQEGEVQPLEKPSDRGG